MVKYLSQKELLNEAYKKLVPLNNQRSTCEAVASLISNHLTYLQGLEQGFKANELPSYSMLLIGRTGCGKSEIFKKIGSVCGLQVATVDATNLSAAGWKGLDLNDAIRNAINLTDNPKAFEHDGGIVIFDEIDKLAYNNPNYIEGNAQPNFLKLLEKDFVIQANTKESRVVNISTEKMLFVFTGAFSRLGKQLSIKYGKAKSIGFLSEECCDTCQEDYLQSATMKDLEEFGMLGELLGRIGSLQYIPPLTKEDYITLIKGDGNSLLMMYQNMFSIHGVAFSISDEACMLIGEKANEQPSGARSLFPIMREELRNAFSEIDEDYSITSVRLETRGNELQLEYGREGHRKYLNKQENSTDVIYFDMKRRLTSESGIFSLCSELLEKSDIEEGITRVAFFYCMQAVCRYLALETNPEDQCFLSLIKLVKHLEDNESSESVFDILIEEVVMIKNNESDEEAFKRLTMKNFYELYKKLAFRGISDIFLKQLKIVEDSLNKVGKEK